jgi:hypothetical protein
MKMAAAACAGEAVTWRGVAAASSVLRYRARHGIPRKPLWPSTSTAESHDCVITTAYINTVPFEEESLAQVVCTACCSRGKALAV